MPGNAFVYGTLMAEEVLRSLLRRVPTNKPAVLAGYKRYRVRHASFPAILPAQPEDRVQGKVLLGLSKAELQRLDVYESGMYVRTRVNPVAEGGERVTADVYVWREENRDDLELSAGDWSYGEWRKTNLSRWVGASASEEDDQSGQSDAMVTWCDGV
eukprot:CAMPEP_0202861696 /NCGR_PEP_ID=MMETSP1391-20130828/3011_1 /ASSEMBLY_ACC=CAM_ASM_000867 /TAXON_ID=1034604 /ORGANISM="Chlamydomonas leiostraca, Strain SAG 11-49" /LENGTH=156 /DNA_ID=CAMNT_0049541125 /DNA_START=141 /DNA_END=612 /DNA_ORIENTATION=+